MSETTEYERALRAEIAAIRRVVAAIDTLDKPSRKRIVRYIVDRYLDENPVAVALTFDE